MLADIKRPESII